MKNQYEIDYQQGYDTANEEWLDRMNRIRAEIFNACSDSYHMPVYRLSCEEIFEIIDKHEEESKEKKNESIHKQNK